MDETLFRKYEKIHKLAEEGAAGERENAKKILETFEEKYPGLRERYAQWRKKAQEPPKDFLGDAGDQARIFLSALFESLNLSTLEAGKRLTQAFRQQLERDLDTAISQAEQRIRSKIEQGIFVSSQGNSPRAEEEIPIELDEDQPSVLAVEYLEIEDSGEFVDLRLVISVDQMNAALKNRRVAQELWEAIIDQIIQLDS